MKRLFTGMLVLVMMMSMAPAATVFATDAAAPVQQTTYTVQPGDTLYKIAAQYGTTVEAIQQANGLTGSIIYIGQVLTIPGSGSTGSTSTGSTGITTTPASGTYTVKAGDTLYAIAHRSGTTVQALQQANGLTSTIIYIGQVLQLSGSSPTTGTTGTTGSTGTTTTATGTYTVKRGDTLYAIAAKNGTTVAALQQANGISGSFIYVGQVLNLSGSGSAPTTGSAAPTTAAPPTTVTSPVVTSAGLGGFGLGGQVAGFGSQAESAMKSAKMTWVKRQVFWGVGSNASDQRDIINDAHARGFKIVIGLIGGPEGSSPEHWQDYANYAAGLASLGADAIEVWNEQNIDREWQAGTINPASYTSLLKLTYNAIKTANPNTVVISGAPAPTGFFGGGCTGNGCDDLPFIQGMVNAGALPYLDCVGIHYNEGLLSPGATSGDPRGNGGHYTRYYQSMVDQYWAAVGGQKPLCFTEIGYLSGEEWGTLPGGFLWRPPYNMTVAQHAQYLGEAVTLSRTQGRVAMMIVFNVDFTNFGDDPMAGFAIIRPSGGCPACDSMAAAMP